MVSFLFYCIIKQWEQSACRTQQAGNVKWIYNILVLTRLLLKKPEAISMIIPYKISFWTTDTAPLTHLKIGFEAEVGNWSLLSICARTNFFSRQDVELFREGAVNWCWEEPAIKVKVWGHSTASYGDIWRCTMAIWDPCAYFLSEIYYCELCACCFVLNGP